MEEEADGILRFLDTKVVVCGDGSLTISVFRKKDTSVLNSITQ